MPHLIKRDPCRFDLIFMRFLIFTNKKVFACNHLVDLLSEKHVFIGKSVNAIFKMCAAKKHTLNSFSLIAVCEAINHNKAH